MPPRGRRIYGDDISSVPWNYSGRVAPARIGVNDLSGGHKFGGYIVRPPSIARRHRYFPIIHLSQNLHLLVLQPPKPNLKSTPTRTAHTPPLVLPRPRIVHVPRRGYGHSLVVSLGQSLFLRSRLFKISFCAGHLEATRHARLARLLQQQPLSSSSHRFPRIPGHHHLSPYPVARCNVRRLNFLSLHRPAIISSI